jgi:hypothetical protein
MKTKKSSGKKEESSSTEESKVPLSRDRIAMIITIPVIAATVLIAFISMYIAEPKESLDYIGKSLVPLWGTWIGAVIAFYFGKVNLDAATQSYKDVITNLTSEEKIAHIFVKDVMVPQKNIVVLKYEDDYLKPLKDILILPQFKPYDRFAVFEKDNIVKAMIHRGIFYEFMHKVKDTEGEKTLKDLLESQDENIKNNLTFGFDFVKLDATVLDAKKMIDSVAECHDVFITLNGKSNEPVLGLLTDNRILELSKV